MLSIRGVYENGKIRLLEHVPKSGRLEVIITFLEGRRKASIKKDKLAGLLSDLQENDFQDFLEPYQKRGQDWFKGRGAEV
jgi:hypothetical protein